MKAKNTAVLIMIIIVFLAAGYFLWKKRAYAPTVPSLGVIREAPTTLGGQIYEGVNNPVKNKLPETNPFQAETNPFKNTYQNPFGK